MNCNLGLCYPSFTGVGWEAISNVDGFSCLFEASRDHTCQAAKVNHSLLYIACQYKMYGHNILIWYTSLDNTHDAYISSLYDTYS